MKGQRTESSHGERADLAETPHELPARPALRAPHVTHEHLSGAYVSIKCSIARGMDRTLVASWTLHRAELVEGSNCACDA